MTGDFNESLHIVMEENIREDVMIILTGLIFYYFFFLHYCLKIYEELLVEGHSLEKNTLIISR